MKKKIKSLCETRFLERQTTFEDLDVLYLYIISCLEIIYQRMKIEVGNQNR